MWNWSGGSEDFESPRTLSRRDSLSPVISDFRDDERRLAEPSFEPRSSDSVLRSPRAAAPRGLPAVPATYSVAASPPRQRPEGPPVPRCLRRRGWLRVRPLSVPPDEVCSAGYRLSEHRPDVAPRPDRDTDRRDTASGLSCWRPTFGSRCHNRFYPRAAAYKAPGPTSSGESTRSSADVGAGRVESVQFERFCPV